MPLYIGDSVPSKIYLGNTEISRVYRGADQVWPAVVTPPPAGDIDWQMRRDGNINGIATNAAWWNWLADNFASRFGDSTQVDFNTSAFGIGGGRNNFWDTDSGASTTSSGTGPLTNNTERFWYFESSSPYNPALAASQARTRFDIDGGRNANTVLKDFLGSGSNRRMTFDYSLTPSVSGKSVTVTQRNAGGATISNHVYGSWLFGNTPGTTITDSANQSFTVRAGGWRRVELNLNDNCRSLRFQLNGGGTSWQNDLCFREFTFTRGSGGGPVTPPPPITRNILGTIRNSDVLRINNLYVHTNPVMINGIAAVPIPINRIGFNSTGSLIFFGNSGLSAQQSALSSWTGSSRAVVFTINGAERFVSGALRGMTPFEEFSNVVASAILSPSRPDFVNEISNFVVGTNTMEITFEGPPS